MDLSDRIFISGNPNPEKFGWSIRSSAGDEPDPKPILQVSTLLGRDPFVIDGNGYECEIFGAAIGSKGGLAYLESRVKNVGFHRHGAFQSHFDVSIKVHLITCSGRQASVDIESYNPFFGCDVRYFKWHDDTAVLIYREKHWTFACRLGDVWPPGFAKIEDRWVIRDDVLAYIGYKRQAVHRLTFPELNEMKSISVKEAERLGQLPLEPNST